MKLRVALGRFLIRLAKFIESLTVVVMNPDELIDFNRMSYAASEAVAFWGQDSLVDQGLFLEEEDLLAQVSLKGGRLLILGLGGGREAIPLVKMGFEVVGVDFIKDIVDKARENAARHGVQVQGLVQEFSQLEAPPTSFDLVVIARTMYSSVPTRTRRVQLLKKIRKALKPGGYLLCQFILNPSLKVSRQSELLRKTIALLSWGNRYYQKGDVICGLEFHHVFLSEEELRSEFADAGFDVEYFQSQEFGIRRGAILRRSNCKRQIS